MYVCMYVYDRYLLFYLTEIEQKKENIYKTDMYVFYVLDL